MHPAPSIIVFTTLSGAGFGLMALLGLGMGPNDPAFALLGGGLALFLAGAGLAASLFHLGNPQRAWRALPQWRSSWLSREGVLAIAAIGSFCVYCLIWAAGQGRFIFLGVSASLFAIATVYATSMIYGGIKAVPRWSKTPTPSMFLAYAGAGGALAFTAALLPFQALSAGVLGACASSLVIAAACAMLWMKRAAATRLDADGSTPETAIGLPALGRARLFEAPHTSPNYLMKEMVFRIGRKHAETLRRLGLAGAFLLPLALIASAAAVPSLSPLMLLALPIHLLGVAAFRWLFFAEAEHVVSLYYGYR